MPTFTVKAVESDAEYIAALTLISLVFRGSVDTEGIMASIAHMNQRPAFQRDQHRIGVLDGEVVAHAVAWPCSLRYGEAVLTFGGIGVVCSHPDQRMKGYGAAVMSDTVEYMEARGDHFSLLGTGEVNFYTKFGYQTLWSDGTVDIKVNQAPQLNSNLRVRAAAVEDLPQMAALFDRAMG
jgi:predicted N-acetyltransferase YhbS